MSLFSECIDIDNVDCNNSHGTTTISRIYLTEFFMRKFRSRIKCLSGPNWKFVAFFNAVVIYYENVWLVLFSRPTATKL